MRPIPSPRLVRPTAVLLVLLGLLPAACGGSGGGTPTPVAPVFLGQETRVDRTPAGSSETSQVAIRCDAGLAYAVWRDVRNGFGDIYFNVSVDGGRTWGSTDVRLDTDAPGVADSTHPVLCSAGARVYVAWLDDRDGQRDVYFNVSLDAGRTWRAGDVRLDTDFPGFSDSLELDLACDGDRVCAVWTDLRSGTADVRLNASADAGSSFFADDVRVDHDPTDAAASTMPRVGVSGERIYVAWEDDRSGLYDVYFNRSLNAGATWEALDTRIDTASPNLGASRRPRLCCDGSLVYVVWTDTRTGLEEIRANASSDAGANWLADDRRLDTDVVFDGTSLVPEVACVGGTVHVVWQDDRSGNADIRYNRSQDAGLTWLLDDERLDTDPTGSAASRWPQVCADGAYVYVAWLDDRLGPQGVRMNWSTNAGSTWQVEDARVDRVPAAAASTTAPRIGCDGSTVRVAWTDGRFGAEDVYVNGGTVP